MPGRAKHARDQRRHRKSAEQTTHAEATARTLAHRVRQIAFGMLLLGAGLAPFAPAFESTPTLRLISQMFLLLSGMLVVAAMCLEGRLQWVRTGLGKFVLLLLVMLAAATVNANYKFASALSLFSWFSAITGFFVTLNLTNTRRRRVLLLLTIGASAFVVALHGLHQALVELPEAREMFAAGPEMALRRLNLPPDAAFDFMGRLEKNRVFSTFFLPNGLAGYLILVIPALAGFFLDMWRRRTRDSQVGIATRALLMLPLLAALWMTQSKAGWLAFIAAAVCFAVWAFWKVLWRYRLHGAGIIIGTLIVASVAQMSGLLPKFSEYTGSGHVRFGYWRVAVKIMQEHPVLGVGLDNFADFYTQVKGPQDQETRRAHSDYLQLGAESGVLGLGAYLLFIVLFWRRMRRRSPELRLPVSEDVHPSQMEVVGVFVLAAVLLLLEMLGGGTFLGTEGFWGLYWLLMLGIGWVMFFMGAWPWQDETAMGRHSYATIGIACGLIAFFLHSFADMDHYVGGILDTAWILMALLLSSRLSEEEPAVMSRPIGAFGRFTLLVGSTAATLFIMYGFVMPVAQATALRDKAMNMESRATLEQRRMDLQAAISANPYEAQNHALLSDIYLNIWLNRGVGAGRDAAFSEAVLNVRRAIELDSARSEYYRRLGFLYETRWLTSGAEVDFHEALTAYRKAEELFPSNPDSALNLARLYDEGGMYDLARGKYRKALLLSQDQYHITRKYELEEVYEIQRRISELTQAATDNNAPPPLRFEHRRLRGMGNG